MEMTKSTALGIVGDIIEIFEGFLEDRDEGDTAIYGEDYYQLEDGIMKVLVQQADLVIADDSEYMEVMMND